MDTNCKNENIEFANRILNHRDELSDEEVGNWLDQPEDRTLLDEVARIKQILRNQDFSILKEREWQHLQREIRSKPIRLRKWWMSVAAILVCAIGLGLWFEWQHLDRQVTENKKTDLEILPGWARAELILAYGKNIPLGNVNTQIETKEISGIVNDSVNGLNYRQATVLTGQDVVEYNILRVPTGGFYKLELSDGTKVWLNAASELRFPVQFNDTKREVYLNGEGYFEVAEDKSHQFVVHLKNAAVTVLGTKFNVSAYEGEKHIYTTLCEGAVSFYSELNKQQMTLQPGMQSVMNIVTGRTEWSEVDPSVYTSWVNGSFVFHSLKLETIMHQLQRWYDFEIFYQNPEVKEYVFRGVVNRDMSIKRVLKMIERTTDVHFTIDGRTVVVSK